MSPIRFMTKYIGILSKILGNRREYGIHMSIVLFTFAVLLVDIYVGPKINKGFLAGSVFDSNIDYRKADILLARVSQIAPPLTDILATQTSGYLVQGSSFFDKPSIANTVISGLARDKITTYTVSEGETYWTIAYKFEIDIDTLLWSNEIKNVDQIEVGKELIILPATGLLHVAEEGDTVAKLASGYKASEEKIIAKNELESRELIAGQKVFIPDVKRDIPKVAVAAPPPVTATYGTTITPAPKYGAGSTTYSGPALQGTGAFAWPINSSTRFISQYFGWVTKYYKHTGIDMDWRNGLDIIAADRGTVVAVGYGWGGGYGNHVIIDHGNGYQTLYGHLAAINVAPGQSVNRSQSIGVMGTTGISSGVHLHFEIRQSGVAIDPLAFVQ